MGENNKDYIRKNVDTIILNTLDKSDSYGYEILKEIETKSKGMYVIKQPTLYNCLKRLEKTGFISSYTGNESNGGKRKYYSLTDVGKQFLIKERREWEFSRTIMSNLLSDKEYDLNSDSPPPYDPSKLRPITKRRNINDLQVNQINQQVANQDYNQNQVAVNQNIQQQTQNNIQTINNNLHKEVASTTTEKLNEHLNTQSNNYSQNNNLAVEIDKNPLSDQQDKIQPITEKINKTVEKNKNDIFKANEYQSYPTSNLELKTNPDIYKEKQSYKILFEPFEDKVVENKEEATKTDNSKTNNLEKPPVNKMDNSTDNQKTNESSKKSPNSLLFDSFNSQNDSEDANEKSQKLYEEFNNLPSQEDSNNNVSYNQGVVQNPLNTETYETIYNEKTFNKNKSNVQEEPYAIEYNEPDNNIKQSNFTQSKENLSISNEVLELDPEIFSNKVKYRPALDELFHDQQNASLEVYEDYKVEETKETDLMHGYSFNSLKNKLKTEGYTLRAYNKNSTNNYYLASFIYSNQINRDCFTIMYLLLVGQILGVFLLANKILMLPSTTYITLATALIFIPIIFWIKYAINPNKRMKAKFNFKTSILSAIMIFLDAFVIVCFIGFFLLDANIKQITSLLKPIIIPFILLLNIPFTTIVYSLLYNTRKYHLR